MKHRKPHMTRMWKYGHYVYFKVNDSGRYRWFRMQGRMVEEISFKYTHGGLCLDITVYGQATSDMAELCLKHYDAAGNFTKINDVSHKEKFNKLDWE